ncbi:MAG: DUF86 domain-containing protein [Armatimonadota bacterium]|nr:DUF86 domain-containing protein [Armatimonadota bacterium]
MPIDREVLVRKSTLIAEDLVRLRSFANLPVENYLSRLDAQLATERLLERMIGRMLDVNYHIAVELGGVAPKDFFESFLKMAELGVLPSEFARRIAQAAGLRNRLAHEYNEIDPRQVHQAAGRALADIPIYLDHLQRFLDAIR